jgi:predicted transcriptional regulator
METLLQQEPSMGPETIISFVQRNLKSTRGQWAEVARKSGVPYYTLTKIAQGKVNNPRVETVQRLIDYFNGAPARV